MAEESPNQDLLTTEEVPNTQHEVEEKPQEIEQIAAEEDDSLEEDSIIGEDQKVAAEEDTSIKQLSSKESTDLQNNSPDFQEVKITTEPVTIVVDPQEANKNFSMELKRRLETNNIREFESRTYNRNTVVSVSANDLFAYLNSRYYTKDPINTYSKHLFGLSYMPSLRTCRCFMVYNLFLLYLLIGASLFSNLEENIEMVQIEHISSLKNDTAILLATELRQVSPHEPIWAQYVFKHLDIFEENLMRASGMEYWRRAREGGPQRWTSKSSLFYSLALMTRTGYCSMSPKSEWGRTATVCYSLFAVPLALAWCVITGRALAHIWSRTLDVFCCYICLHCKRTERGKNKDKTNKTTRTKTNSIGPIDKLNKPTTSENDFDSKMKFQELRSVASARSVASVASVQSVASSVNNIDREIKLISMDHAMCIVFAVLLFVVYFVIGSALMAIEEDFSITDSLYLNFLMLATIGPACSDFEDSLAEVKISNQLCHFFFLYGGYSIISMVFYLIFTFYFPTFESYWTRKKDTVILSKNLTR